MTQIISGLRELARDYDALVCDVWGVLHNGHSAFPDACAALKAFKDEHGPVVLLTNAPRPAREVEAMFVKYGVPLDCYDAIVTSGSAARDELIRRSAAGTLATFHLGPEKDFGIFDGLNVECVEIAKAEVVLCTGPFNDDVETPDDYVDLLSEMKAKGLVMLCANPDWMVQRGGKMIYCAGALANEYEKIGGAVVYYGKPKTAIYENVRTALKGAKRPLAIGDGMHTDIKGANAAGMDALFIADGVHGEDVADITSAHLDALFRDAGVQARAAMRKLVW